MAIPSTVERAIADAPVAGARCLEAGAGVGNMTAALREPVPWTADLLDAHADPAREPAERLDAATADALRTETRRRRERLGDGVDTGRMYSLAFRLEA